MVQIEARGKVHVARVAGTPRIDESNHEQFAAALLEFFASQPGGHLLVSLAGVEFLSSAALSALVRAMRAAMKDGGSVRVCDVSPYVLSVFEVTRLDTAFRAGGALEEAAEAFETDLAGVEA